MIKEISEHLYKVIEKAEYDDKRQIERDIEDMSKLVYSVKSNLELLEIKSELVQEIKDGLIENLSETKEVLDKCEILLEAVDEELQNAADEDSTHQAYCQEIFDRR